MTLSITNLSSTIVHMMWFPCSCTTHNTGWPNSDKYKENQGTNWGCKTLEGHRAWCTEKKT